MQTGSSRLRVPPPRTVSISLQTIVVAIKIFAILHVTYRYDDQLPCSYNRPKMGAVVETFGISINH